MQPFRLHTGIAAPLDLPNIDTDQIIPKQFLKRIERTGFGQYLFFDWRLRPDGSPNPEFVLNDPRYAGASILIGGKNFGCGSSRDYGFRAVIAPYFADIFSGNCAQNGILLISLEQEKIDVLLRRAKEVNGYKLTVDLEKCEVRDDSGFTTSFSVDPFRRHCFLEGLDDIALTLQHEPEIAAYEAKHFGQ